MEDREAAISESTVNVDPFKARNLEVKLAGAKVKAVEALGELASVQTEVGEFFDRSGMSVDDGNFDNPPDGMAGLVRLWASTANELELRSFIELM